jgi:S-(hydroxymethyl)glutathione dehydrogenase/alcohol dehydrogenase
VRVRIAAAGVCHSDLHVRRGEWQPPTPLVMGHEGAGTVTEIGAGVTSLAEGDHVVLSWVAPCGQCRYCEAGREARCQVAATIVAPGGTLQDGTSRLSRNGEVIHHYLGVSSFAEEAVVPASGAIKVREDAPLSKADAVEALHDLVPGGVDYAFDAIGLTTTTEQAIAMLGLGGAAVVVGLPPTGARASFEPLVLAEADQRILGSNYGSVRPAIDIPALVDRYMDGQLSLDEMVSSRRPLEAASASLDDLDAGLALRTLLIPGPAGSPGRP